MTLTDNRKTVLIADDHPIFRQGLKQIVKPANWLRIVAEAESGDSAVTQIKFLKPDITILDLAMPGMDGFKVLKNSLDIHPAMLAVIVTSYNDPAYLERALELGARGYVVKDSAGEHLIQCLESVVAGDTYISPSMGNRTPELPSLDNDDTERLKQLTATERKILEGVARFLTSKELARELDISYRTVQNHRANIATKLNLPGRHQLVRFARRHHELLNKT